MSALECESLHAQARQAEGFEALAALFKRVKNITLQCEASTPSLAGFQALRDVLSEPAERALVTELEGRWPRIDKALHDERFLDALTELAHLHGPVDRFFVDVLVMAEDPALRQARLTLLTMLRDMILMTAGDISEIAPDESR